MVQFYHGILQGSSYLLPSSFETTVLKVMEVECRNIYFISHINGSKDNYRVSCVSVIQIYPILAF